MDLAAGTEHVYDVISSSLFFHHDHKAEGSDRSHIMIFNSPPSAVDPLISHFLLLALRKYAPRQMGVLPRPPAASPAPLFSACDFVIPLRPYTPLLPIQSNDPNSRAASQAASHGLGPKSDGCNNTDRSLRAPWTITLTSRGRRDVHVYNLIHFEA